MNDEHMKKAFDIISERRNTARTINQERFEEINQRIPEIAEINRQLFNTSQEIMHIIRNGRDVAQKIQLLEHQNKQAQYLVKQLLKKHNYPEDYLEISYTCSKCNDTGYYNNTYCSCLLSLTGKIAVQSLNKNSQISLYSFDKFSLSYYAGRKDKNNIDCYVAMEKNFNYCQAYAKNFAKNSPSILMFGNTGLGKTHLSLSIASEVLKKGFSVLYDSVINFLTQIEKEHFGKENTSNDTLSLLLSCDLLILDDLGTEFDSSFYHSVIYNIVNTRINRSLPTIISTNMNHDNISYKYDERISSRIFSTYTVLEFIGYDIRVLKSQKKPKTPF